MSINHYEIAIEANRLRDLLGNTIGIQNIFTLLADWGYEVFRYPLGRDSMLGLAAVYGKQRIILTNTSLIQGREIFTAAHELGHHILHLQETDRLIIDEMNNESENLLEKEADYFAACFLMPKHILTRYVEEHYGEKSLTAVDIAQMQSVFNVSFDALVTRLRATGIITEPERTFLQEEKTRKTARSLFGAIEGNENLLNPSNAKRIPPECLKIMLENYKRRLVPKGSIDRVFNYFDIPCPEEEYSAEEEVSLEARR